MITAQQAVQAAQAYVRGLYDSNELRHFRLEELERSDDAQHWEVTLGWDDAAVAIPSMGLAATMLRTTDQTPRPLPRLYKRILVNAETGEVEAMKIRDVG